MKRTLYIISGVLLVFNIACNKLIDVGMPKDSLTSDVVFQDESTALSALNGLYIQYMATGLSFTNSLIPITTGLMGDELTLGATSAIADEFLSNSVSLENSYGSSLWNNPYSRIYQCNALIEGAAKSSQLDQSLKNRLEGEARFNRAFLYFYLVQLFGDVPLILSTDYNQTAIAPRTEMAKVYEQIDGDLLAASNLLSADITADKTRLSKWAVQALRARVALYLEKWDIAEQLSGEVINSGLFKLSMDLKSTFIGQSEEAIWQIPPTDGNAYVWEGFYFIPKTAASPTYPIRISLIESFSEDDKRLKDWIGIKTANSKNYGFAKKYQVGSGTGNATEFQMMLRLAEQYLIRAEARSRLGKQQEALNDLDKLRERADIHLLTGNTDMAPANVQSLVMEERRHELFCEWGHRWFDLKRSNQVEAVIKAIKPNFQPYASMLPIPLTQLRANPKLIQNPGYSN